MLRDYLPLRPLGSGATGIVFLAIKPLLPPPDDQSDQQHDLPRLVAVKAFRRSRTQDLQRSQNEETILSKLLHAPTHTPFLPRLQATFEDGEFRFLVLDFFSGGDLNSLRHSLPEKRFSSAAIRFYAAEIVLALEHLHDLGIVYRDLKPENILLSADGHIVLSDFDLSITLPPKKPLPTATSPSFSKLLPSHYNEEGLRIKQQDEEAHATLKCLGGFTGCDRKRLQGRGKSVPALVHGRRRVVPALSSSADSVETLNKRSCDGDNVSMEARSHTFVGTEEYVAPELIKGTGHDFGVDWWALGVLLFEMAYACTPFAGRTTKQTFHNIVHQQLGRFPGSNGAATLSDLISQLLVKDPSSRLGSYAGAAEVKAHPFFAGVLWDELPNVLRPPFIAPSTDDSSLSDVPAFDITAHLVQVECSRAEARAKKRLERKQFS